MTRGKYIVLEGPEGVGKTTQLQELGRRLQAAGLPVRTMREPDSQSDLTARAIRQLTQDPRYPMNTRTEVLLYNAARAQSLEVIRHSIEHGVVCLVDRNYLTTLAIQYYGRGDVPDYQTINSIISFAVGDMEPDLCILLDAPVNVLHERLQGRYNGERFDSLSDEFLERVRAGYLWEAHQRKLPVIFATDTAEQVADNIWKLVSESLAVRDSSPASAAATAIPTSVKDIIEQKKLPDTPEATPPREPPIVAHTNQESVKQPADIIQAVVEGVSYLLAPAFTVPHIGGLIPQPNEEFNYYTPEHLDDKLKAQYQEGLDMIYAAHQDMRGRLEAHIKNNSKVAEKVKATDVWLVAARTQALDTLQAVLPLASTTAVSLTISRGTMNELITDLLSQQLPESQAIGQSLQREDRATTPVMLEDDSVPDGTVSVVAYRRQVAQQLSVLAAEHLPDQHAPVAETVILTDFWPKNELLLVSDMLYEHSNQSLESLQSEANGWSYARKAAAFKAYIGNRQSPRHRPGTALEKAHYSWDIISDYASFLDIQQNATAEDLAHQVITPRYGYEVPLLIEEAGLTDQFEACFEASLKLHSYLQKAGYTQEAQYVTLLGNLLRWKATYNAREAFKLLETPYTQPTTAALVSQIQEKLAEVHPLTAECVTTEMDK